MSGYVIPFLSGGITVAAIKYLGNYAGPSTAAVIGVFPIGLLSSIFIEDDKRLLLYLYNYQFMIICLACATVSYRLLMEMDFLNRGQALVAALILWSVLGLFMKLVFLRDGILDSILDNPPPGTGDAASIGGGSGWSKESFAPMKLKVESPTSHNP